MVMRKIGLWLVTSGLFLVAIIVAILFFQSKPALGRVNVLVASDPVTVWSWNTRDTTFTVVTMPSDLVITGLHGYGQYSLEALWKLGFIDKKNGFLLSDSVEEAIGVPGMLYIGKKGDSLQPAADPVSFGTNLFSYRTLFSYLTGRLLTNIPFSTFLSMIKSVSSVRPDKIHRMDLTSDIVASSENLPDGSMRNVFDPMKSDVVLEHTFQDDAVRQERYTTTIYNTTSTPALGNRMARLLSHMGVFVLSVSNDTPDVGRCTVEASVEVLKSETVRTIVGVLGCRPKEKTLDGRTDIIVRVGSDYAKIFN